MKQTLWFSVILHFYMSSSGYAQMIPSSSDAQIFWSAEKILRVKDAFVENWRTASTSDTSIGQDNRGVDSLDYGLKSALRFRGLQLQGSTLIFAGSYGGCLDIDFYKSISPTHAGLGLRFSLDKIISAGIAGGGHSYLQSGFSARYSFVIGDWCATDYYAGIAYRSAQIAGQRSPGLGPLFGWDLRLGPERASKFGLLIKISGGGAMEHMPVWGGIGLFAGWLD